MVGKNLFRKLASTMALVAVLLGIMPQPMTALAQTINTTVTATTGIVNDGRIILKFDSSQPAPNVTGVRMYLKQNADGSAAPGGFQYLGTLDGAQGSYGIGDAGYSHLVLPNTNKLVYFKAGAPLFTYRELKNNEVYVFMLDSTSAPNGSAYQSPDVKYGTLTPTASLTQKTEAKVTSDGKVQLTFPGSNSNALSISVFLRNPDNSSVEIGKPITYTISDAAVQTQVTDNNNGTMTATIPRRYLTDKSGASPVVFENGKKYYFVANGLHSDDIMYQGPATDGGSSCLVVPKSCAIEAPTITKASDYYVLEFGEGIPDGNGSKEEASRDRIRIFGTDDASKAVADSQANKMASMEGASDWDNTADGKFTVFLRNVDFSKTYNFEATIVEKKSDTLSQYGEWPDVTRTLRFSVSSGGATDASSVSNNVLTATQNNGKIELKFNEAIPTPSVTGVRVWVNTWADGSKPANGSEFLGTLSDRSLKIDGRTLTISPDETKTIYFKDGPRLGINLTPNVVFVFLVDSPNTASGSYQAPDVKYGSSIQNVDTGSTTAPAAVNKVDLTENAADATITAKWDAVSGADDYEVTIIYAQPADIVGGSGQNLTKKGTTKGTSYSISAYAGVQYNVTVRARKSQLYSASTSSGITTTSKKTSFTADDIAALSLPKATLDKVTEGETATAKFDTVDGTTSNIQVLKAEVKWTAVTIDNPAFSNYRVFWRKKEASPVDWKYAAQVAVPKDVTKYTITAIDPNSTYEYMVSAEFLTKGATSTFRSITDVQTFNTGDAPKATFSTNFSSEYTAALKRRRVGASDNSGYLANQPTNLSQEMKIFPILKNADGSTSFGADLFANVKSTRQKKPLNNTPPNVNFENANGEWYYDINIPAAVASKMTGVAFGSEYSNTNTGKNEAIYLMKYVGGTTYGSCDNMANGSACRLSTPSNLTNKNLVIPMATLVANPHVQMETLALDSSGNTRSSSEGITIEYFNELVGLPVHLNFNIQAFGTTAAEVTNLNLKAAQESQDSNVLDGFTSSGKVNLTFEARNATKCYVRENEGAWTELNCANTTGNQTVPYTLKTTTAGDVRLQLKIDSASGSQESNTFTVKLDTALPTVTLSGFPTSWASAPVSDLSVSCAAGSSSCKQMRLVQTNKLSENQTCGDLQTVAPSEISVAAVCSASNNNCKDLSFESEPGAQKTYICAVAQNNSGKFAFSQKYELKVDTKIPEVLANLKDLIASGAATFTKDAAVTVHVNPVTLGPSGLATCQVAGDITSPVSCTANGGDYNVNLTSDSGSKKITVSATNNAGKAGVKELNIIRDATAPVFVSGSAIKISNKTTNGAATLQPAPAQDAYLDRVELTVRASHDTNFVLPGSVLASIPADVRVQGNKLTILANEVGQLAPAYVTTGLSLQNLPVDANGQAISYTIEEKAFDKAGNAASETKTVQFTLRDVVSTEAITITSGSVALSGEVDSSTIPVTGLVFSGGPVFYTTTENGTESAKSAFNNFVFLSAGAHTGVTVKFYDSQNRQIGSAYGPFNVTVKSAGATMTLDGAQVIRVKDATYALKATSIASTDDKVTYKISKNGTQLTTGERVKANYASAFDLSTIELAENARTEVFVTVTDAAGKSTIYQKTLIRDTRAPEVKGFQTSTANNTPTWTFTAQDELDGTVQELKARAIDLTTGEASAETTISVVSGGSYSFSASSLTLRPGHEYVLDVTAKDALGNSKMERSPQPVVLAKSNVDLLDMLQKGITVDGSIVNTERLRVTLTNTSDSTFRYQAELPRGKQIVFKDILEKGQHTGTNAKWTKLPVGVYQARLETVGANTTGTQNVNFVVEPYYADSTGDLNGDGRVGMSDEVIYKLAQNTGKYAGSDNSLATLRGAIDSKLAQSIMSDLREYLRR